MGSFIFLGIGLITVHGGKLLKSMVAKWLPGVGAVAMVIWSKYSTNMIGKRAAESLNNEIVFDKDEMIEDNVKFEVIVDETCSNQDAISKNKINLLINLMKIDGKIADEEVTYISSIIEDMV